MNLSYTLEDDFAALPESGLSDPGGSLSTSKPAKVIAEANMNVQKATQSTAGGLYKKYSTLLCMWSEIGTSVSQYGAAARFKVQFKVQGVGVTRQRAIQHISSKLPGCSMR